MLSICRIREEHLPDALFGEIVLKIEKKIGVNVLMRVSAKGGSGVYLYIPRDYADAYGIDSGDKVEAKLIRAFKEKEIEEKSTDTVDISQTKRNKR